jgi:hypothetical protein
MRLFFGYSLLALTIAIVLAIAFVTLRRRRLDHERRYGKRRPS